MINRLSFTHEGTQPVRVLQHNIIAQFENTAPDFLVRTLDAVFRDGLKPGIKYYVNEHPICHLVDGHSQTPFVNQDKAIHLHETFTSYVWCVAYSLVVLYDEAVAKPAQNQYFGEERNIINTALITKAQELFNYGISLIRVFSNWDKDRLPNPEYYHEEDEQYILQANAVYVYAINFILCHEFIHVERQHIDRLVARTSTPEDNLFFEQEADRLAIEAILAGVSTERRETAMAGILAGICCLLYFKSSTLSNTHPDTDERIDNFLDIVRCSDEHPIWGMASLGYRLWDNQFLKGLKYPMQIQNFKEMYEHIKAQVKAENNVLRNP